MTVSPGTKLGPYEIIALLGAGGMGEVYRARDTRLGREVAVKLLPPAFAADAERLRRFEAEARAVAALSHPNIVAIHDVGSREDGSPFLVSELLEGQTLREKLDAGPLPVRRATEYSLQIAHGLAAAHEKGITHRDLKPENIFVTRDGRVKILDFGLARLAQSHPAVGAEFTRTSGPPTAPGLVMGTVGYMSPEQVRGDAADHHSDIFSFGAILYELLSGLRAFQCATPPETMTAILREEPPELSESGRAVPPALDRIVRRCLEKAPGQRFHSASDLAFAIESLTGATSVSAPVIAAPARRLRYWPLLALAGIVLAIALGYLLAVWRTDTSLPVYKRLTFRRGTVWSARFAPESREIVYSASWDGAPVELFSTRPDSPESRPLGIRYADILDISPGAEMALLIREGASPIAWDPAGAGAFNNVLARAPLAGGAPREVVRHVRFASWMPGGGLAIVRLDNNGRARLEMPLGNVIHDTTNQIGALRLLPGGGSVIAERGQGMGTYWSFFKISADGKIRTEFSKGWPGENVGAAFTASRGELWLETGTVGGDTLFALSLNGKQRVLQRPPARFRVLDASSDGRLLMNRIAWRVGILGMTAGDTRERELSWLDASEVDDVSADGRTILITEYGEGGDQDRWSVYLRKTDGSPAVRLGEGQGYALSADGRWALTMRRTTPPQLVLLPTGAGQPVPIENHGITDYIAADWLDDKRIVFAGTEAAQPPRCYVQSMDGGKPVPFTPPGVFFRLTRHPISPDGKWLAGSGGPQSFMIYPLDGGDPRPVPGLTRSGPVAHLAGEVAASGEDDTFIGWTSDGTGLYVARSTLPAQIFRLQIANGQRQLWKQIAPADTAGLTDIYGIQIAQDDKSYFYSYVRNVSDLYLVENLK